MKIITYATHRFGTFDTLIESVPDIIVLGWGTEWTGFIGKCKAVLDCLYTLPNDEIVMVVDGFDTIIKKDLTNVEQVFKSMNCKILASGYHGDDMKPLLKYTFNKSNINKQFICERIYSITINYRRVCTINNINDI